MPNPQSRALLPALAVLFGISTLGFGMAGRVMADGLPAWPHGWIQTFFESAGLLMLQPPPERALGGGPATHNAAFSVARVSAVLFVFLGTLSVLVVLLRPVRDAWLRCRFRWARVAGRSPAVVIGSDPICHALTRDLGASHRPVYVLTDQQTSLAGTGAEEADAIVIDGDAADDAVRGRADIRHATEVFVAAANDARNVEIASRLLGDARGLRLRRGPAPLHVYVHAGMPALAGPLASHRLLHDSRREIAVRFFNLQEQAARDLLLDDKSGLARVYAPDDVAHYLVLGFGDMGQTVALQMGRLAHFDSSRRVRLSVFDSFSAGAADARSDFLARYPGFAPDPAAFDMIAHRRVHDPDKDGWHARRWRPADPAWRIDVADAVEYAVNGEFVDVPGSCEGPRLVRLLLERIQPLRPDAGHPHRDEVRPALVICFDDESRNLRCALALREALEAAHLEQPLAEPLPVYVYLPASTGFASMLRESPEFRHSRALRPHVFGAVPAGGVYDRIVRPRIMSLASRVHESYRHEAPAPAFEDLPPLLQASNVDAAAHLALKRDALDRARGGIRAAARREDPLTEAEIELLARMEHNRWMAERLIAGFRMGERKTTRSGQALHDNRRRPSMVPWERLSQSLQSEALKDVRQVVALLGTPAERS